MKNTFLNRVSAERKILKIVNKRFPRDQQLAGLSQAALFRWQSTVSRNHIIDVLPLLIDLAEKCQRLSDRSNETFMPIEEEQVSKLDALITELDKKLSKDKID